MGFAWLPIPLLLLAIALCLAFDPQGAFQSWWLLVTLSVTFSSGISILVAYLAAKSYLAGGSGSVLLLGCGMLIFGVSNTVGSVVSDLQDPNLGLALFNIAVMFAGACHLASAIWAAASARPTPRRRPSRLAPALAYGAVLLGLWAILTAIRAQQLPRFFVQGQGPTPIRYVVLGVAILLLTLAATQFWTLSRRAERPFFRWYGLGLGLIAVGLAGVYFQKAVGTPLNWVGRSAQYLGGVYILVAILTIVRDRSVPLGKTLALLFGEAETSYRPLVEAARDAILSVDQDARVLYWNQGATRLFGYTPAEAFKANLMALVAPPGAEERMRAAWEGLPRTPEGQMVGAALEVEVAAKGGRTFWAELAFYARPTARGNLTVGIVRDISDRKRAEAALREVNEQLETRVRERTAALEASNTALQEDIRRREAVEAALRESQERLALAADATQIGMFDWNVLTGEVLWTPQHELLFGYPATSAPTTKHSYREWANRVHPDDLPLVEKRLRDSMANQTPYDAEYRVVWLDGSVHWIENRGVFSYDGDGRAARMLGTVLDVTERKQAEEERRSLALFPEQNPYPILRVAQDGTLLYANAGSAPLLQKWSAAVGSRMPEVEGRELLATLQTGAPTELLVACGVRVYSLISVPISALGYVNVYGRDITERERAENELRRALADKDTLIQEVHHRTKNNLQMICSLLELQAERIESAEGKEALEVTGSRIYAIARLYEQLYRSLTSGSVLLCEYLTGLTEGFRDSSGSHITFHMPTQRVSLDVDRAVPCGLIVNELLTNAVKHAFPAGTTGEIGIELQNLGDRIRLRVWDTGCGLPAGLNIEHCTSLGLRLVAILARRLKAEIAVENANGTAFTLTFPSAPEE